MRGRVSLAKALDTIETKTVEPFFLFVQELLCKMIEKAARNEVDLESALKSLDKAVPGYYRDRLKLSHFVSFLLLVHRYWQNNLNTMANFEKNSENGETWSTKL